MGVEVNSEKCQNNFLGVGESDWKEVVGEGVGVGAHGHAFQANDICQEEISLDSLKNN